jgi:hypothetical protein
VRYNDLLKFKRLDKQYESIVEGDKIFIVNLKPNMYKLETIGLPNAKVPDEIEKFVKTYIDVDEIFESLLLNKLKELYKTNYEHYTQCITDYKDIVNVNLLLFDPVHGTYNYTGIATGFMPKEQDVSGVYEKEEAPDTSGTTIVMPVVSGHWGDGFTPQMIGGYQRIIIVYGSGAEHGSGILGKKNKKKPLSYGGKEVKGMQLTTNLPKGLCVVNTADMNIIHVSSMAEWETFADKVLGKANKTEQRNIVIQNALKLFLPS